MIEGQPWGKFYAKAFTGSMMGKGAVVYAVMAYCVANAKPPDGIVELKADLLGFLIGETEDKIVDGIKQLMAEDPKSRSKAEGGRRLIRVDGDYYRLVNWLAHRNQKVEDVVEKRKYWREKAAESRARRGLVKNGKPLKGEVAYVRAADRGAGESELGGIVAGSLPIVDDAEIEVIGIGIGGPEIRSIEEARKILESSGPIVDGSLDESHDVALAIVPKDCILTPEQAIGPVGEAGCACAVGHPPTGFHLSQDGKVWIGDDFEEVPENKDSNVN